MPPTPAMYPTWVFYFHAVVSAGVLLAALGSMYAAARRRWALTMRLGRMSVLGGVVILTVAVLMVMGPPVLGMELGPGTASKATRLARTIAELMNTTAIAVPGFLIGAVTWPLGALGQRRRASQNEDE